MAKKVAYYAIVDDLSSREARAGALRGPRTTRVNRTILLPGTWSGSKDWSLYSYERGNRDAKFYEISEDEANQIVERIRRIVAAGE